MTVPTLPAPTDVQQKDQNDIVLVDYLDDGDQLTLESSNAQQPSEPQARWKPTKYRHPPQWYSKLCSALD